MVINPIATGAVYLSMALPITAWTTRYTARPWAAGVFGAIVALAISVFFNPIFPFNYWAHARDFIIEPYLERKAFTDPKLGMLTTAFHVGVPIVFAVVVCRLWPPRER